MSASPSTEAPSERPTVKPKDTKRHAVLPPKRFSDISMDPPHPPTPSKCPLPHLKLFTVGFPSAYEIEVWNRAVCVCVCVLPLVCFGASRTFLRSRYRRSTEPLGGQGAGRGCGRGAGGGCGHTSVCRSMISWPTRGMVALVFSHSTACNSKGDDATVSRSFLTQDGGEWVFRMPSHALLLGVCGLSYRQRGQNGRGKNTRC